MTEKQVTTHKAWFPKPAQKTERITVDVSVLNIKPGTWIQLYIPSYRDGCERETIEIMVDPQGVTEISATKGVPSINYWKEDD